jgi:type IV pilus assembly protein PilX
MVMLILFVLTILVVNAVRSASMNEKMAGNYMDRNRAMQAAEQALRKGEAALATVTSGIPVCLDGCDVVSGVATTPAANPLGAAEIPVTWASGGNHSDFTITIPLTFKADGTVDATKNLTASYRVALLADNLRDPVKAAAGCKAYSIMGKGAGIDARTDVVLQTIAYVCPA